MCSLKFCIPRFSQIFSFRAINVEPPVTDEVLLGSISPTCLCKSFMLKDPNSAKRLSSHQCLFVCLGSACPKATRKMLVKSTPGWRWFHWDRGKSTWSNCPHCQLNRYETLDSQHLGQHNILQNNSIICSKNLLLICYQILMYRRTSLSTVDTFRQMSSNTETANTESDND